MRYWLSANGGPLALAVLGVGIGGFTNRYAGIVLIAVGVIWFAWAHVHKTVVPNAAVSSDRPTKAQMIALRDEIADLSEKAERFGIGTSGRPYDGSGWWVEAVAQFLSRATSRRELKAFRQVAWSRGVQAVRPEGVEWLKDFAARVERAEVEIRPDFPPPSPPPGTVYTSPVPFWQSMTTAKGLRQQIKKAENQTEIETLQRDVLKWWDELDELVVGLKPERIVSFSSNALPLPADDRDGLIRGLDDRISRLATLTKEIEREQPQ